MREKDKVGEKTSRTERENVIYIYIYIYIYREREREREREAGVKNRKGENTGRTESEKTNILRGRELEWRENKNWIKKSLSYNWIYWKKERGKGGKRSSERKREMTEIYIKDETEIFFWIYANSIIKIHMMNIRKFWIGYKRKKGKEIVKLY